MFILIEFLSITQLTHLNEVNDRCFAMWGAYILIVFKEWFKENEPCVANLSLPIPWFWFVIELFVDLLSCLVIFYMGSWALLQLISLPIALVRVAYFIYLLCPSISILSTHHQYHIQIEAGRVHNRSKVPETFLPPKVASCTTSGLLSPSFL